MANKDFEQKMREELQQLLIRPSNGVWNQVKASIEPRKRKKRWLFWIPLGLAILLGGGYLILSNGHSVNKSLNSGGESRTLTETNEQDLDIVPSSNSKDGEKNKISEKLNPEKESDEPNSVSGLKAKTGIKTGNGPLEIKNSRNSNRGYGIPQSEKKNGKKRLSANETELSESDSRNNVSTNQILTGEPEQPKENISTVFVFIPASIDRVTWIADSGKVVPSGVLNTDSALKAPWNDSILSASKKPQPLGKSSRIWSYGITGRIGVSTIQNGVNLIPGVNRLSADQNQASNGPGIPASSSFATYQSEFSWGLGFEVERKLGKKWSLVSGLQYQQYRSSIQIGKRVDSSRNLNYGNYSINLDNYYQAGKTNTFQNKLHYLEWPLLVEFHSGNKLPFYIRTGMNTGYLLGSSLIHQDQVFGIYYQDPDQIRKWQWSMKMGAGISLFHRQKHELNLGPEFQYFFSNLFSSSVTNNKHVGFTGLLATWKF